MKAEHEKGKGHGHEHDDCCESRNTINWFEIPAADIQRAQKFYSKILGLELFMSHGEGFQMAIFPGHGHEVVHGALVQGQGYIPSEQGTVVYLNGGADLNQALGKVEAAGGKILKPKFGIGEHGFIAFFRDTEGNKVALHSMK